MKSFYAISVYGQGHVFAYNRVRGFHDGIDHATYGMPDNWPDTPRDRMPVSIDIYNNDISVVHDNCIEADGAMHNIRVHAQSLLQCAAGRDESAAHLRRSRRISSATSSTTPTGDR